jgi:hypothetical protein
MWDFDLMAATRTLEKSMPFALYRFLYCLGVGFGCLLATLAGAGTLVGFASLAKNASAVGPLGAAIGFAGFAFLMHKIRPFWLRYADLPQLGLLADLSRGESLPGGGAQIDYAKKKAAAAFPSTSALFQLDGQVRLALADMVELPAAGLFALPRVAALRDRLVQHLFARNDRSLLAWHFRNGSAAAVASLAGGLAVIDQHGPRILKHRLIASGFEWAGFALAFPLLLAGIRMLIEGIPIDFGVWPWVFAGVFAWVLKAAFFEPIAEAAMMQVLFPLAEQGPNPAQVAELAARSEAYRELREAAAGQV